MSLRMGLARSPCHDCPYRRDAPRMVAHVAAAVMAETMSDYTMFCKTREDELIAQGEESSDPMERVEVECSGASIFFANTCKLTTNPFKAPRLPPDRTLVFGNALEFLAHHNRPHPMQLTLQLASASDGQE